MRDTPNLGEQVYVTERPQLIGEVVEVVTLDYVKIKLDSVEEPIGVNVKRLSSLK